MNEKNWIERQIIPTEIEKYLDNGEDFINEPEILAHLSNASPEKSWPLYTGSAGRLGCPCGHKY